MISLGRHPPTEGIARPGAASGSTRAAGTTDLSGINVGLMIEIPGMMSRGNWTAAVYVDKRAKAAQLKALTAIMTGQARGTTHLLSILVGEFLGVFQEEIR